MGKIRYFILDRVNEIRRGYCRNPLYIHEEMSDSAQGHAQYVLEEMLKWGGHRYDEIKHFNPYKHGEYARENMGFSGGDFSLEQHINRILKDFEDKRFETGHFDNMLNSWEYIGTDVAYDASGGSVVLVQRFAE